ncbi:MAG: GNAT family N-acetyltransferase [Promethearchaeota archaeon]
MNTDPRLHYIVLELDEKIFASCALSIIPNLTKSGRSYGLIENVVTHTDYRRRGFGTLILQFALEVAWKQKCYKIMFLTGSKDPAVHQFYEKAGFIKDIKTGFVADVS